MADQKLYFHPSTNQVSTIKLADNAVEISDAQRSQISPENLKSVLSGGAISQNITSDPVPAPQNNNNGVPLPRVPRSDSGGLVSDNTGNTVEQGYRDDLTGAMVYPTIGGKPNPKFDKSKVPVAPQPPTNTNSSSVPSVDDNYKKLLDRSSGLIQSTTQSYQNIIDSKNAAASARINASGLAGSSAGGKIRDEAIDPAIHERNAAISKIYSDIETQAENLTIEERKLADSEQSTAFDQARQTEADERQAREDAQTDIKKAASLGGTFDDFQKNYPKAYDSILQKGYGGNADAMKVDFAANAPAGTYQWDQAITSGSNILVPKISVGPDGKQTLTVDTVPLPLAPNKQVKSTMAMPDGSGVLVVYEDGTTQLVSGTSITNTPLPTTISSPQDITTLGSAISNVESGGNYNTPENSSGAIGKYQIVADYWFPSIGLDPNSDTDKQKFLNNPALQDQLFSNVISTLSKKYDGDTHKIVAAYFGGEPGAKAYGTPEGDKIKDANGTSINQYVDKVLAGNTPKSQITEIGDAIISGRQPPVLTGLYGKSAAVKAYLESKGFDLTKATQDYEATKKYIATLNGPAQVRLRQAVNFAYDSLPIIEDLSTEWSKTAKDKRGTFVPLNSANLALAKSGAYGDQAASVATRLETQISDLTSELGTVYKGGNGSTDDSLALAAKNLNAGWSEKVLKDSINLVRQNLGIRKASINSAGIGGIGGDNAYDQTQNNENFDPKTAPDGTKAFANDGTEILRYNGKWQDSDGQIYNEEGEPVSMVTPSDKTSTFLQQNGIDSSSLQNHHIKALNDYHDSLG